MKAANVNINWNQNGDEEHRKTNVKQPTTAMPTETSAEHDKDEKPRRCRETENEE